jgi:hypothetical protein
VFGLAAAAAAADTGSKPGQGEGSNAGPPSKPRVRAARRVPYRDCCEESYRFVYAEGWYGSEKLVAPVRHGPLGDEVLVPGSVWQYCAFSCEYTLRKQSLGYWQSLREARKSVEDPGYPRQDSYVDGWGYRHGYLF